MGSFRLAQVTSIFTGTSISPDALSRQRLDHYAFRAGRNSSTGISLPWDNYEFTISSRLLRLKLRPPKLTSPLNLPAHRAGVSPPPHLSDCIDLCFAKQSAKPILCGHISGAPSSQLITGVICRKFATCFFRRPWILSSSTCVGLQYEFTITNNSGFFSTHKTILPYFFSVLSIFKGLPADFLCDPYLAYCAASIPRLASPHVSPQFSMYCSTEFSTCCPSATSFRTSP